jgi:phenylacetic acid degradation operon negative regulatory protein
LLLTVLGELVVPDGQPVWTASLLHVLSGLGVTEQTARQTIARAADSGWLLGQRVGREVCWVVSRAAIELIEEITRRVASLHAVPDHWDGLGVMLHVSVPTRNRAARRSLYNALRWAGFGSPAPGLWVSPHVDREAEVAAVIDELGLRESTMMVIGRLACAGLTEREILARAWDLEEVSARYATLIETYENRRPEPGDEVLLSYLSLVDEWRKFPNIDPQLPRDLPPDWIGGHAADMFRALRARWKPAARERWADIVALTSRPA